ncbi:MAG: hypothetical protein ABR953_03400 [Candidatus Acidiferrales bacterium]|jgi:hypothetical protein
MKSPGRWGLSILLLGLAFATLQPALAYNYPLSPEAIREAYFLGKRNDEQTAAFFVKYIHSFPMPKSGPYVASIGIDTPYSAIVRRTQNSPIGYHPQEAEKEFLGNPGVFRVWVEIEFTPSYPNPTQMSPYTNGGVWIPDFWRDFKIRLKQDREIEAQSVHGGPIYSDYAADIYGMAGAEVALDYNPTKIGAEPTDIEVITPDGQDIETTFDLANLR